MIIKFNEYWDWKNVFRGEDNPNIVADELFKSIKSDIKENIQILTTVKEIEDGFLEMTLSNKSKVKIILTYDEGDPTNGLISLKPNRKEETQLEIDFPRAKSYYDYIMSQTKKNIKKATKKQKALDVRDAIKKLNK